MIKINGYSWKIINLLTFSIISLLTKSFVKDISVFQIFFCFKAIAMVITFFVYIKKYRQYPKIITNYLSIARALVNITALVLWFLAIRYLDISDATIISYTTPIFGVILGYFLFKEQIHCNIVFAIIFGAIGCFIVVRPTFSNYTIGTLAAFASAFLWSIHDSIIKMQTIKNQTVLEAMFQSTFLTSLISLPFALMNWTSPDSITSSALVICGLLSFVNLYALGTALQREKISFLMPISFLRVVFVSIGGYIFYNEKIGLEQLIGLSFILLSHYFILEGKFRKSKYK